MLVKHCMTPNPRTASPEDDVRQTFELLKAHGFHQLPVVKEGRIVGIVTDRDLRTGLFQPGLKIKDVMTPNPITIFEDVKMEVAAQIINSRRFNAIPVVDSKGDLVGIITTHDIIE
ncbi:MAG: CBS domain-containing protein, partial [Candidatus Caldarchaeum sp.]